MASVLLPITVQGGDDRGKGIGTPYKYHRYLSTSVADKTFTFSDTLKPQCSVETRSYTRAEVEGGTQVDVLRTQSGGGGVTCQVRGFRYLNRDHEQVLAARQNFYPGPMLAEYTTPLVRMTSAMRVGSTWGGASDVVVSIPGTPVSQVTERSTLLGVEDVTVPAGTFTGCLRIQVERWSVAVNSFSQVSWHCPGTGLVKMQQVYFRDPTTIGTTRIELSSFTPM
jgi:hypothetical protein